MKLRLGVFGISICALASLALLTHAASRKKVPNLEDLARDSYIWGYPAVHMAKARGDSPVNHFYHSPKVPDPFLGQLLNINPENLYSWAWLDLSKEPVVLPHPAVGDRYYSVQFVDAYATVFYNISNLLRGDKAGTFLLVGPTWEGDVASDLTLIRATTPEVFVIAQTFVKNSKDLTKVLKLAGQRQVIPLSHWQKGERADSFKAVYPSSSLKIDKNFAIQGVRYYSDLKQIVDKNPPPTKTSLKEWERFAPLGANLNRPEMAKMIERGFFQGEREIQQRLAAGFGTKINGWAYEMKAPPFTDDYLLRAAVSQKNFFSPPSDESLQLNLAMDSEGRQLTGSYRYMLHFEKDDLPPVRSMWSLKVHEMKSQDLENPGRPVSYINDKSSSLKYNMDGSMDILLQAEPPSSHFRSNWLRLAKNANFYVVMTFYHPNNSAINRMYIAPSLGRLDEDRPPKQRITHTMIAESEASGPN